MASIRLEMALRADPAMVWNAVRDVGAIHTRLAPDFVKDVKLEGDARVVSFANGLVAKEQIVTIDNAARRLAYAVVQGRPTHHSASIQIVPETGGCRLVWIADLLPNELEGPIGAMMQQGMDAMKRKLEDP
jgi:uncharacterized protein YndB with AHSA1/START domain